MGALISVAQKRKSRKTLVCHRWHQPEHGSIYLTNQRLFAAPLKTEDTYMYMQTHIHFQLYTVLESAVPVVLCTRGLPDRGYPVSRCYVERLVFLYQPDGPSPPRRSRCALSGDWGSLVWRRASGRKWRLPNRALSHPAHHHFAV